MRQPLVPDDTKSLQIPRIISLLGAFLYPILGFVLQQVFGVEEPIPSTHRMVFAAGFGGLAALSFISSVVRKFMGVFVYTFAGVAVLQILSKGGHDALDGVFIVTLLVAIPVLNVWSTRQSASVRDTTERKEVENRLRQSEEKYRALTQQSMEGLFLHDLQGNILEANQTAAIQGGYSQEELSRLTVFDLHPKASDVNLDRSAILAQWKSWEIGESQILEAEHQRKDGTVYPVEIRTGKVAFGGETYMLALVRNTTERKEAEEQLAKRDQLLTKLSQQVPGAIYQYRQHLDGTTYFPFASDGIWDIYEVCPDDVQADATLVYSRIHPDDRDRVVASIRHSGETLDVWEDEYRVLLPEKGLRWVRGLARPEKLPDGSVLWHGYLTDVSEIRNVQDALQLKTEELERYFASSLDLLCIADTQGRFLRLNPQWKSILGYALAELEGRSFLDFVHPEDVTATSEAIQELNDGREVLGFENRYRCQDGTYRWIAWSAKPVGTTIYAVARDVTERRRMEDELRESEERFRALYESSPVSIVIHDADTGDIIDANDTAYLSYGFASLEELQTMARWADPPYSQADALTWIHKAATEGAQVFEWKNLKVTGEVFWEQARLAPVTLNGVLRVLATTVDITDRKQAEVALENSERKYRALVANVPGVIFQCRDDANLTMEFISEGIKSITGYEAAGFIKNAKRTYASIIHSDDLDRVLRTVRMGISDRTPYTLDYRTIHANGSVHWVRENAQGVYSPQGEFLYIYGVIVDVTEQKQLEDALRQSEEKFRQITENMGEVFWLRTADNARVIYVNPAYEAVWGRTCESLYEDPDSFMESVYDQDRPAVLAEFERYAQTGAFRLEYRIVQPSGEIRWVSARSFPVREGDAVVRHTGLAVDITERKEAEQEIEYLSYHDTLTGLYNRRFWEAELARLDVPRNLPLALCVIDVNGLKLTNDAFGHQAGDRLLKDVAKALKKASRSDDIVARTGGDEFAILLPQTDEGQVAGFVQRVDNALMGKKVEALPISVSSGWAAKSRQQEAMASVFRRAEDRMYQTKVSERRSQRHQSIELILQTLNAKAPSEQLHSQRVSELCRRIGMAMGLGQTEVNELATAGTLHDIGKIAISNAILSKAGSLNESEWVEIKRHPEVGSSILSTANDYASLAESVLTHHERWDGAGYPRGLKQTEIPLTARIIAIADAYDAMTSDKPYRQGMTPTDAIEEIEVCAGFQFAPDIVKEFVKMMGKGT